MGRNSGMKSSFYSICKEKREHPQVEVKGTFSWNLEITNHYEDRKLLRRLWGFKNTLMEQNGIQCTLSDLDMECFQTCLFRYCFRISQNWHEKNVQVPKSIHGFFFWEKVVGLCDMFVQKNYLYLINLWQWLSKWNSLKNLFSKKHPQLWSSIQAT